MPTIMLICLLASLSITFLHFTFSIYLLKSAGLYVKGQCSCNLLKNGTIFAGVPWYKHSPSAKTYSLSNILHSLADGACIEQMTVRPVSAKCFSSAMHCAAECSSKPLKLLKNSVLILPKLHKSYVVGSSSMRTAGLLSNSKAIQRRLHSPPDK